MKSNIDASTPMVVADRLAAAERELAATRATTVALQRQVARSQILSRVTFAFLAVGAVWLPAVRIDAQNKPPRLTVRAPFVVEDDSGKAVFIVQTVTEPVKNNNGEVVGSSTRPRLILGDSDDANILMTINTKGGAGIGLMKGNVTNAFLQTTDSMGVLTVKAGTASSATFIATGDGAGMTAFHRETPVAVLEGGPSGNGRMFLKNPKGENIVEAGAIEPGLGIVRTGPNFSCASGALAQPCKLVGHK